MAGKTAIVTGINGQDGSYLAEFLISKGYNVIGLSRRRSASEMPNISHLLSKMTIEYGDVTDSGCLHRLVDKYRPDEFYNLAAQSFVSLSWSEPIHTSEVTAMGVLNCLEAIRNVKKDTKFYQASSSEMFGKVVEIPQKETTPFYPRSPYGVAKVYGYWITRNYRESYGIFATNGILFNHESPRRGLEFVTRKITDGVAKIKAADGGKLALGNLDSKRDWGFAGDYMEAAWLMLQQDKPDDYVIATGETHSIKEFLARAFGRAGLDWSKHVEVDSKFIRPAEVDILIGDPSKAVRELGWKPRVSFHELVDMMTESDLARYGLRGS
jgi:GDPmannose 4,6-dehydratase